MTKCRFLAENGSPISLALRALSSDEETDKVAILSYSCSNCGLCSAICPVAAEPDRMFKELRNHAQANAIFRLDKYDPLLNYERLGQSFPFKREHIPVNCSTVFFPGCTLPAMYPDAAKIAYKILKRDDPNMGLILNCCSKPSKMLGLKDRHEESLSNLINRLERKGIKKILTACPNCHMTFKEFNSNLEIVSIYKRLRFSKFIPVRPKLREVTVHDPCVTRNETDMHKHVRLLLKAQGIRVIEMRHNRKETICCGEGGATNFHKKTYAQYWSHKRINEAQRTGVPMVTYCAGCVNFLGFKYPTTHILDLLLIRRKKIPKPALFPFNYLNRLIFRFSRN